MKNRQLIDELEHWQTVIGEQLALTEDTRFDEFIVSLKQLDNLFDWGLMDATPEQKKEIIATVLHGFVIYPDRVEFQYKVPHEELTEEQVAELLKVSRQAGKNRVLVARPCSRYRSGGWS